MQTTVRLALLQHDALCASLASAIDHLPPNQLVHLSRAFPPARHTELVAKTLSIADVRSLLRMPPYCRHGCKLMAVPRGLSRGFLAAETGRPLPLPSLPLKQTHGAWPKGSTLPCTMQNATSVRAEPHRARSRMLSGGGACTAGARRTPRRGSAAAHEGEGTLLAAGPREACSYVKQGQQQLNIFSRHSFGCSQQRHVELPHLHSQQQTLSTASRVVQA